MGEKGFQMCDNCCGCSACSSICPQNAIKMEKNIKGFLYPNLDETKCVACGLCMKACPLSEKRSTQIISSDLKRDI